MHTSHPRPVVSIDSGGHRERFLAKRNALVEEHLHLVEPIAHRVQRTLPPSFDLEDLVAVGRLALIQIATRYRPLEHGGAPFSAFARPRIRGAMIDSVRRRHWEENTRPSIDELFTISGDPEIAYEGLRKVEPSVDDRSIEINTAIDEARLRKRVAVAISRLPALPRATDGRFVGGDVIAELLGAVLDLPAGVDIGDHSDAIMELRRRLKAA